MRRWHLWAVCGILVLAGGLWLWSKGYGNILAYGMLLLCPLMHLFMHVGHHSGGHANHQGASEPDHRDHMGSKERQKPACH